MVDPRLIHRFHIDIQMRYLDVIIYREYCSDFVNILIRIEPRVIVMKPIQEVIHHSKNRIVNSPSAKAIMALLGPVLFWSKHKVCTARLAKRVAYAFHFSFQLLHRGTRDHLSEEDELVGEVRTEGSNYILLLLQERNVQHIPLKPYVLLLYSLACDVAHQVTFLLPHLSPLLAPICILRIPFHL